MDLEVKTRVIKRNGEEVDFRLEKIVNAIKKANEEVENIHRMNDFQIIAIAEKIAAGRGIYACSECGGHPGYG